MSRAVELSQLIDILKFNIGALLTVDNNGTVVALLPPQDAGYVLTSDPLSAYGIKWDVAGGGASLPTLTASQLVVTDVAGALTTTAAPTLAELGYLTGVTGAIQTQLNGKAASAHTHTIANITSLQAALDAKAPAATGATGVSKYYGTDATGAIGFFTLPSGGGGGVGDMLKAVYDTNNDGVVDVAAVAQAVAWTGISGKPSVFLTNLSSLQDTFSKGDLPYAATAGAAQTLSKLAIGSAGQVLSVDGTTGLPKWTTFATTLPTQTGNANKWLQTNGTTASWRYNELDPRWVNVKNYGAVGDGVTDDRVAIQNALDAVNAAGGGVVWIPPGTYIIGNNPTASYGRYFGLLVKSNTVLLGSGSENTTLKAKAATNMDLVVTLRLGSTTNVAVCGLRLDGNEAAQTDGKINLWFDSATNVRIDDIYSYNPGEWGIRVEKSDTVRVSNVVCQHSDETNSDGMHFVDTDNVVVTNVKIYTLGDDAFAIGAISRAIKNYAISGLFVSCPNSAGVPYGKRGIMLGGYTPGVPLPYSISGLSIDATVENCLGPALHMDGGTILNANIKLAARNTEGIHLTPGNALSSGKCENCHFDIAIADSTGVAFQALTNYGTFRNNTVNISIYSPGDGDAGVTLYGDHWRGKIDVDYNPRADKSSLSYGCVINSSYNNLTLSVRGAATNILMQAAATYNMIDIPYSIENTTAAITCNGSNNKIRLGHTTGTVTIGGTNTQSTW